MTKKRKPTLSTKTAMTLGGTHTRNTVLLDYASGIAMQYSQAVARHLGGQSVPASAIARRALFVYALHLEQKARDDQALTELRALKGAALGHRVADEMHSTCTEVEAQEAARQRVHALRELPKGVPLPGFLETLHSPAVIAARAASYAETERRVDELVDSIAATPWGRLRGIRKT